MLEEYTKKIQIEGRVLSDLALHLYHPSINRVLIYLGYQCKKHSNEAGLEVGDAQRHLINRISVHIDELTKWSRRNDRS